MIHTLKIWEQHNMSGKIKLDAHFSVLFKINSSFFFLFQNIHSEMYSLLIETYIEDSAEK